MKETSISDDAGGERSSFYRWATVLAAITVFYNLLEGSVSVFFGLEDETVSLFGFGIDSFVEVISGLGIWHMVRRMERNDEEDHEGFERTALRVTGTAFYLLAAALFVTAVINLYTGHRPETTLWAIIVAAVSILTMWLLIHFKTKVGRRFGSQALLADAACTKTCLYLSVVLLIAGIGYEVTGIGLIDSLGALAIGVFSFKEGREAFGKARGESCCCENNCG